jgi:hypothetical protein
VEVIAGSDMYQFAVGLVQLREHVFKPPLVSALLILGALHLHKLSCCQVRLCLRCRSLFLGGHGLPFGESGLLSGEERGENTNDRAPDADNQGKHRILSDAPV